MTTFRTDKRGMALVLVLAFIVILSMMIVAFSTGMRTERQAAHYYAEKSRADLLAQAGMERVKSSLLEATDPNTRSWITMPGRIVSRSKGPNSSPESFELYSRAATDDTLDPIDLNRKVISGDGRTAITGATDSSAVPMKVGWIYVRRNGEQEAIEAPDCSNRSNPIVGRYAYWTDDESCRINLNTAWRKLGSNSSLNHPSQIDLRALGLSAEETDTIHDAAGSSTFASPEGAMRLGVAMAGKLAPNRFSLSHYTLSSDRNPWGQPKIVLTTQSSNLPPAIRKLPNYKEYYLDILKDEKIDPGYGTTNNNKNIDEAKYAANLNKLMGMFARTDWRVGKGSLIDKYGYLNCLQMASDIIEYVRAAESSEDNPIAIRFSPPASPDPGNDSFSFLNVIDDTTLRANTRQVRITELAILTGDPANVPPTPDPPVSSYPNVSPKRTTPQAGFKITVKAELYLPAYPGQQPINLENVVLDVTTGANTYNMALNSSNTTPITISPGGFASVAVPTWMRTSVPSTLSVRAILFMPGVPFNDRGNYAIWDIVPLSKNTLITLPTSDPTKSVQVNDPRVNKFGKNWTVGPSTFGAKNYNWCAATSVPAGQPPQDLGSDGKVTSMTLTRPARKGSSENPHGRVRTIAELGYIHTGIVADVPWRTLRLQPTPNSSAATLPDWAILDLFTAPLVPNDSPSLVAEITDATVGTVNLNAKIYPFDTLQRTTPIEALFHGNSGMSEAQISAAAANVFHRTYARDGVNYGGPDGYASVGELAEIAGVADGGEASERTLYGTLDLGTVQGSIFRIFSVGQSLRQTPRGELIPQAQKSILAIVENRGGKCRTVYFQTLPY